MKMVNRLKIICYAILLLAGPSVFAQRNTVRIGILTDCQYCNCETEGKRHYGLSLMKLDSCIEQFNKLPLDAVFHLGDMIDHGYGNYDSVLPRFKKFRAPFHMVLGNHDYMIHKKYKEGLTGRLGLDSAYYRVDIGFWTLLVLNGDDLSYFAPQSKHKRSERNEMVGGLYSSLRGNGMLWNGGIGAAQMRWIAKELDSAEKSHRNVILLCHFPIYEKGDHNLFNNLEMLATIKPYRCVKAYFNGHYHNGNYAVIDGIHLVNFRGMVDTKQNAFADITLTPDSILIKGYGREPDRNLKIRK